MARPQAGSRIAEVITLRGPVASYAREHAGLAAFWRAAQPLLARPAAPQCAQALATLDAWLRGEQPLALLSGDPAARTETLVRFAVAAASDPELRVVFLPISACFGTAAEHDALTVLFGLFPNAQTAYWSSPRTPSELRWSISEACRGNGEWPEPRRLLILDGLERAADWDPDRGISFLESAGPDVHLIVSAGKDLDHADAAEWRRRLRWSDDDCTTLDLGEARVESAVVARARRALESADAQARVTREALDALAVVLAPITLDELAACAALPAQAARALAAAPEPVRALVTTEADGSCHLHDDTLRCGWRAGVDERSVEQTLVAGALQMVQQRQPNTAWPDYLVRYSGAHLARSRGSLEDWQRLLGPDWLAAWLVRSPGLVGFLSDVWRARTTAGDTLLFEQPSPPKARAASRMIVWCTLVERALCDKQAGDDDRAEPERPYRPPTLDVERSTHSEHARAEALATLASELEGAAQQRVEGWLAEITAALPTDAVVVVKPVPRWDPPAPPPASDPALAAMLRAAAPDLRGIRIEQQPAAACAALGAEQCVELASSAPAYLRISALAKLVPHLPEAMRPAATAEALTAYLETSEEDALRALLCCAPWMSVRDAARLLCARFGTEWQLSYEKVLIGWGGLTDMIPLLDRIGGASALLDAAQALDDVGRWLR
ncbi:MAG TPA: hypothetical protein VGI10_14620 [Polyangiaceae bacterium]|jgi:hypothetical protein